MRDLAIAYGNSCMAKFWSNKTTTWEELKDRLETPIRTTETVEEYKKMKKADRDVAKDKGGFVCGKLKGGRRKIENVVSRSVLTLDVDNALADFVENYEMLSAYTSYIYSTHSHTPEAPRLRLLIPLTRDVTPDEYVAIARYFAAEWGIDQFDECSYKVNQLMYLPSCPSNGEYVFETVEGEWLDPDKYLSAHPDWKDISLLPTSSRESVVKEKTTGKKQKDPLQKDGIVGAFCNAYPIRDTIEFFLGDVYAPSTKVPGRYDYLKGESAAGVLIYEEKFAMSHHATDPASGMLLNSFDLVRVHRFGNDDEKKSFKQMCDFALKDEKVKKELLKAKMEAAGEEFNVEENDWTKNLELEKDGSIKETLNNIVLILHNDQKLKNIAFNLHRDGIDARGGLPWKQVKDGWNDTDNSAMKVYLSDTYGIYSPMKTKDAIQAVAAERAYHPIKEYFDSLPEWDGVERVERLYIDYFNAEDTPYTRAVARKSMIAAVRRIYIPGFKFDTVPILNGPQGIGKSTFFARLAGKWYSDSLTIGDMKDKAGPEKLQGYWILELSELAGMKKAEVETIKSFISRVDDKYRASYGISVENHPRQCIIVGTTNAESGFLRDITGNRRFWPLRVNLGKKKPWELTQDEVDQIWAETLVLNASGEKLIMEGDEAMQAADEQSVAMESDEREGLVREYLEKLLPENWNSMDLFDRRSFLNSGEIGAKGTVKRDTVCNMEIWCECFGKESSSIKKSDSYEIGAIMAKIDGWERYTGNKDGSMTFSVYGKQRAYKRK